MSDVLGTSSTSILATVPNKAGSQFFSRQLKAETSQKQQRGHVVVVKKVVVRTKRQHTGQRDSRSPCLSSPIAVEVAPSVSCDQVASKSVFPMVADPPTR